VPHLRRADFAARHPVHVTLRLQPGVGYLRTQSRARILLDAFEAAGKSFGLRVVHYAILGNHLHLIVESDGKTALSRGMQALAIRAARRLNALQKRRGGVFADRYHAHVLGTRREVARAVRYLLGNYRRHTLEYVEPRWDDPFAGALAAPRTWLLRTSSPAG
jgi:REP element-mobilizing transposase RayT